MVACRPLTSQAAKCAKQHTVPVKCKLTVSTRNSILDSRCFRESRIENQVSRLEFRVSSFEFRDTKNFSRKRFISRIGNNNARRIFRENDLYLELVTIEVNNSSLRAASFIRARVHEFHINVQIFSLDLKFIE